MKIFDLLKMQAQNYENRSANVFFQNDLFKTRIIVLERGGEIPACQMDSYVIFYVVEGEVLLRKNDESSVIKEKQVFISEPALLSMKSTAGARIMGIQINSR